MALWGTGYWDAAKWTEQVGQMAATETGVDVFTGEGDVVLTGVMAATESTTDTFAANGTVQITGSMAAVETGTDTFAAEGDVQVTGQMAATESQVDTFAAEGDVNLNGTMAATETGVDVFSADGDVELAGSMAATETGVDVFAGEGDVGNSGTMAATETGEDVFAATGTVTPKPPVPRVVPDVGDERQRKKAQKKRDEAFERYAQEQRKLREMLEQAIDPVKAKAEPVVVSQGKKKVEVLSTDGSKVSINVPALFDPEDVALAVAHMLEAANIAAQHVKRKQDEAQALAIARATVARIIKRKRDDELLLLLD